MSPRNEKAQQLANSLGVVVPADKEVGINCKSITAAAAGGWWVKSFSFALYSRRISRLMFSDLAQQTLLAARGSF